MAIWLIRTPEVKPEPPPAGVRLSTQIADGLRFVCRHPLIRPIALAGPIFSFTIAGTNALGLIYAIKELHWTPFMSGLVLGISGLGGLLGGVLAQKLIATYRITRIVLWSSLVYVVGDLPLALVAPGPAGAVIACVGWTLLLVGALVLQISQRTLRQLLTPREMQGRLAATTRWLSWGAAPLGALAAGALAELIGMQLTLLVAAILVAAAPLTLWLSPLRTLKEDPVLVAL
ncbi:MFS transporter [Nonomuraea wenchangensis]|uniref:MFS transporter n=1 Tax=Nonomuraea wenchangensis TaxID=568860 RepID=UPI00384B164A